MQRENHLPGPVLFHAFVLSLSPFDKELGDFVVALGEPPGIVAAPAFADGLEVSSDLEACPGY